MYIAYVYIEEFEGLGYTSDQDGKKEGKPIEICLSNRYVIKKESDDNGRLVLKVDHNPEFVDGFWDVGSSRHIIPSEQKNLSDLPLFGNVSALVGKNGVGKTRILGLLWMLSTGQSFPKGTRLIAIFHNQNGSHVRCLHTFKGLRESIGDEKQEFQFEPRDSYFEIKSVPENLKIEVVDLTNNSLTRGYYCFPVYFSYSFQGQDSLGRIDKAQGMDVSRSSLFFQWAEKNRGNVTRKAFADKEFRDQVDYLRTIQIHSGLKLELPEFIEVEFVPFRNERQVEDEGDSASDSEMVTYSLSKRLHIFFEAQFDEWGTTQKAVPNDLALEFIKCGLFLNLLFTLAKDKLQSLHELFWEKIRGIEIFPSNHKVDLDSLIEDLVEYDFFKEKWEERWKKAFANIVEYSQNQSRNLGLFSINFSSDNYPSINWKISMVDSAEFLNSISLISLGYRFLSRGETVINRYPRSPFILSFYPSPSTGVQAILNQISYIMAGVNNNFIFGIKFGRGKENYCVDGSSDKQQKPYSILLLIDEGDLNFHPEILVNYVDNILRMIKYSAKLGVQIQIVFTTHSPIILSDFPSSAVTLLGKDEKAKGKVSTFGANVHSLLRDEFFLDSTIGKFAQEKINKIIIDIKEWSNPNDLEPLRKRIQMIGDPVLQKRIMTFFEVYCESELLSQRKKEIQKESKTKKDDHGTNQ